jgi:hypothetical protein
MSSPRDATSVATKMLMVPCFGKSALQRGLIFDWTVIGIFKGAPFCSHGSFCFGLLDAYHHECNRTSIFAITLSQPAPLQPYYSQRPTPDPILK